MSNIIKRRKTTEYLQLHNYPVQKDLDDLAAIGLLTYIMSLPEDWTIHKTQLQSKFSRRKVDGAWKILAEKKYIIGFIAYVDRSKNYYYNVSDIPFTEEEFFQFVDETLKEVSKESEYIGSIKGMPDSPFIVPEESENPDEDTTVQNVQQSTEQNVQYTNEHFVQYKKYSSNGKVQNVHIQKDINKEIETKEIETKKYIVTKIGNKDSKSIDDIIYSLTNEYRTKGLSKAVCLRVVDEVMTNKEVKNFGGFLRTCLENALYRSKVKHGQVDPSEKMKKNLEDSNVPYFDWINN